ncbi:MAG TPA: MBL fold metallo-hydrolase [Actinobacteria bacterium]|nr:MBL fold metallo-hydrolase [Actinomycetota bacterium]
MIVDVASLWVAETNAYVLAAEAGGPGVVVDAPPDLAGILEVLDRRRITPVALLVTHGHIDHTGAAGGLVERTGARAYLHPDDAFLALDPEAQLRMLFGGIPPGDFRPPEFLDLADGQVLDLAGLRLEVVHTPGHTPGHCCFHLPDEGILLSGDHLFAGSIGRTDLPGGDFATLMRSMRDKILPLPDDTRVLPGHGPATTIGRERRSNPFLLQLLDRGRSSPG